MTALSKFFKRSEFACKCNCGYDTIDAELLQVLTDLREHFGKIVLISSGARCESHNKMIGGSSKSKHLLGKASDIVVRGYEPHEVATYLRAKYPDTYGIGEYDTFCHVDVRSTKARF